MSDPVDPFEDTIDVSPPKYSRTYFLLCNPTTITRIYPGDTSLFRCYNSLSAGRVQVQLKTLYFVNLMKF